MVEIQENLTKQRDSFHEKIVQLIAKKNYVYKEGQYENKKSKFTVYCPKHDHTQTIMPKNFQGARFGLSCCAYTWPNIHKFPSKAGQPCAPESIVKEKETKLKKYQEKINSLAGERNHVIRDGVFENQQTLFKIYCTAHKQEHFVFENIATLKAA